ncbi:MAG: 50S ribosomal protein L20 [Blastochloris sp.]|nr:50S ribosomal protein L20 [Blastochloris sp.]
MPRATNAPASRERRKRVVDSARGFRGNRSKLYRYAKDATMKAKVWAYRDRKARKRTFRSLWTTRINAAVREHDMTYSRFIAALKTASIEIDRKILAELAVNEPAAFAQVIKTLKS